MGPIRCPETSVKDYHSTLRNNPEERRSVSHFAAKNVHEHAKECPRNLSTIWAPAPGRFASPDVNSCPYPSHGGVQRE